MIESQRECILVLRDDHRRASSRSGVAEKGRFDQSGAVDNPTKEEVDWRSGDAERTGPYVLRRSINARVK